MDTPQPHPEPLVVAVGELRSRLGEALGRVRFTGQRLVVTTHGTPVVAVVPLEDLERLQHETVGVVEVVESLTVALARDELWRTLLHGRLRAPWWSVDTLGTVSGEPVRERWLTTDGRVVDARGEVVALDPGRSLTFGWRERGVPRPTTIRLAVSDEQVSDEQASAEHAPGQDRAVLTVSERGFGPGEQRRAQDHRQHWAEVLAQLGEHVARRQGCANPWGAGPAR